MPKGQPSESKLNAMLIESFIPNPDAVETHKIEIAASRAAVYQAHWTADLGGSPVIKSLMALSLISGFLILVLFFGFFVFRRAIALARAHGEIAAFDAHRYSSEAAVALIVGWIVCQCVLVA